MQKLLALGAALALSAVAIAQSPLTTFYNSNNGGSVGGAVYFDLVVNTPLEITALDINTSTTASTAGSISIYFGCVPTFLSPNHSPASNWALVGSASGVSAGLNLPTNCVLTTPLALLPGTYPVALVANGWAHRYTNGPAGQTTTISTTEMSVVVGGATNVPFTGSQFFPRNFNGSIYYSTTLTQAPTVLNCATRVNYGAGCLDSSNSFYEFAAALSGFDLRGTVAAPNSLRLTYLGAQGYAVAQGTAAFFTPTSSRVLTNAATPGAMGDDSISQPLLVPASWNGTGTWNFPGGSCTQFHACSNGYVLLGATTSSSGDFSPTVAELLASTGASGTGRLCPVWADLHAARNATTNPNEGIYYDVDPSGSTVYVTWLEIGEFANSTAGASVNTFQVAIHQNGDVDFVYGQMDLTAGTSPWLTGFSKGNAGGSNSSDPGNRDLSAAIPFSTNGPDAFPLALNASARPIVGTTVDLVTSNVPAAASAVVSRIAFQQITPGFDLTSLGAPGCFAHVNVNGPDNAFLFGNPTVQRSLVLPANPALSGLNVYSQSAALVPGINALGIITSNAVALRVGTL